jgi:hypothetical protein
MEIWKDIPGYEGLYMASNFGNVASLKKGFNVLKQGQNQRYKHVSLWRDKKQKCVDVHQIIAITFLNHKPNKQTMVIDHIDNDSHNNRLENLQIIDQRTNSNKEKALPCSGIRGVYWSKLVNKWQARMRVCGGKINILYHSEKEVCGLAYDYFFQFVEKLKHAHSPKEIRVLFKQEKIKYRNKIKELNVSIK